MRSIPAKASDFPSADKSAGIIEHVEVWRRENVLHRLHKHCTFELTSLLPKKSEQQRKKTDL